jgi:hypothetical protein
MRLSCVLSWRATRVAKPRTQARQSRPRSRCVRVSNGRRSETSWNSSMGTSSSAAIADRKAFGASPGHRSHDDAWEAVCAVSVVKRLAPLRVIGPTMTPGRPSAPYRLSGSATRRHRPGDRRVAVVRSRRSSRGERSPDRKPSRFLLWQAGCEPTMMAWTPRSPMSRRVVGLAPGSRDCRFATMNRTVTRGRPR